MTDIQMIIFTLVLALSVIITRAIPFLLFGNKEELPKIISYLGNVLPAAMMGLLVVYCFKDINFTVLGEALPALIATIVVVCIHLWKRNTILSIFLGTAIYMILIRIM